MWQTISLIYFIFACKISLILTQQIDSVSEVSTFSVDADQFEVASFLPRDAATGKLYDFTNEISYFVPSPLDVVW